MFLALVCLFLSLLNVLEFCLPMSELGLSVTSIEESVNCLGRFADRIELVSFSEPETQHHKAYQG